MNKIENLEDCNKYNKSFTLPKEHIIYRIKFSKGEAMKYIGHLDVMRLFQRAIKRASLPIAYSQGFNPHQLISFASPLTLGTISIGEYVDVEFLEKISTCDIKNNLNSVLDNIEGIRVLDVVLLKSGVKKAMTSVSASTYEVVLDNKVTIEIVEKNLENYINQDEILVLKKTKKNLKETNIKEDIFDIKNISKNNEVKLFMFLASGSKRNLKPESVVNGFYNYLDIEFDKYNIRYKRIDMFREENGKYLNLLENVGVL